MPHGNAGRRVRERHLRSDSLDVEVGHRTKTLWTLLPNTCSNAAMRCSDACKPRCLYPGCDKYTTGIDARCWIHRGG